MLSVAKASAPHSFAGPAQSSHGPRRPIHVGRIAEQALRPELKYGSDYEVTIYAQRGNQAAVDAESQLKQNGFSVNLIWVNDDPEARKIYDKEASMLGERAMFISMRKLSTPFEPASTHLSFSAEPMLFVLGIEVARMNAITPSTNNNVFNSVQFRADLELGREVADDPHRLGWLDPNAHVPLIQGASQLGCANARLWRGAFRLALGKPDGARMMAAGILGLVRSPVAAATALLDLAVSYVAQQALSVPRETAGQKIMRAISLSVVMPVFFAARLLVAPLSFAMRVCDRTEQALCGQAAILHPWLSNPFRDGADFDGGRASDPENWLAYYAEQGSHYLVAPPKIVRELMWLKENDKEAYAAWRTYLREHKVSTFYRFTSLDQLQRCLAPVAANDDRPLAVVLTTPADHNGAFSRQGLQLAELEQHYRVVFREVKDDTEVAAVLREIGEQKKISMLVLSAHGRPNAAYLSDAGPRGSNLLDITDDERVARLSDNFAPGASVVLESCSTGAPGPGGDNLQRSLQQAWPKTKVYAPKQDTFGVELRFGRRGQVKRPLFLHT